MNKIVFLSEQIGTKRYKCTNDGNGFFFFVFILFLFEHMWASVGGPTKKKYIIHNDGIKSYL